MHECAGTVSSAPASTYQLHGYVREMRIYTGENDLIRIDFRRYRLAFDEAVLDCSNSSNRVKTNEQPNVA